MTIFALTMLLYQGWRVYDYMSSSLRDVSEATAFVVSVAFLAFSEVGLLVWLHVAQPNATTDTQESVSAGMVWTDFAGSMIVGLGDMLKHNTLYHVDLSAVEPLLFLAPWLMVVLNIGGYLLYAQHDSEAMLDQEERRLRHEETRLEMESRRQAVRELRANQSAIAEKLAPLYYRDIHDRVSGRTISRFERHRKLNAASPATNTGDNQAIAAQQPEPIIDQNGNEANPTSRRRAPEA